MPLNPKLITTLKPFKKLWRSLNHLSYKTLLIILVTLVSLIVIFTKFSGRAKIVEAGWWSDNWHYRQAINVTAHSVGETNVYIAVTTTIGSTANAQSDGGDFRFTDSDGNLLPYTQTAKVGSTQFSFQVGLPVFPAGAQTLYIYYGNPSADNGDTDVSGYSLASGYTIGSYGSEEQNTSPLSHWNFDDSGGTTLHDQSVAVSEKGLVSWWKFNEGTSNRAYDEFGLNNLSGTSFPAWTTTSHVGTALAFTKASRHYLAVADSPSLSITGDLTISAWIRPASNTGTTEYTIASKWDSFGSQVDQAYKLSQIGDEIRLALRGGYLQTDSANLATGSWYHVTAVYTTTGTIVKIYINGNDTAGTITGTIPTGIDDNAIAFCIGDYYTGGSLNSTSFYNGTIDQVKLFSRSLSAAEIAAEYGSTNGDLMAYGTAGVNATWPDGAQSTTHQRPLGRSLSFNGSSQYVDLPSSDFFDLQDFTISAWVNPTTVSQNGHIFEKGNVNTQYSFFFEGDNIIFRTKPASSAYVDLSVSSSNSGITADNWFHLVAVRNTATNTKKIYVNGQEVASIGNTGTLATNQGAERIGAYGGSSPAYFFNGQIDELKIFPYALSVSQVNLEYNRGAGTALAVGTKSNDPGKDNLVGWWKMEDSGANTSDDSSGNNLHAILGDGSSAPDWVPGKFGKSLYFNGLTDYAYVPKNVGLNTTGDITISAWVKPDSASPAGTSTIFMKGTAADATVAYRLYFDANNRKAGFQMGNGSIAIGITSGTDLTFNQWQYLTADVQGTRVSLYINASLIGTTNFSGTRQSTSYDIGIGHMMNGDTIYGSTSYNFKGAIDNIKFYNRALTAAEIFFEYNQGRSPNSYSFDEASGTTLHDQSVNISETGLVSWWKFNEGTGTTAYDEMGLHNLSSGSAPSWATGKIGIGGSFVKANHDYLKTPSTPALDITGSLTLSAWIKPSSNTGGTLSTIASKYNDVTFSTQSYNLFQDGDEITIGLNSGFYQSTTAANLAINTWYHVTAVYDQNKRTAKIYINGSEAIGTTEIPESSINSNSSDFCIGAWISTTKGTMDTYNGLIDNVKIYSRALSATEIAADYNSTSGDLIGFGTVGVSATWPDGARSSSFQKPLGRSLSFNGSSQYVTIPDSDTFNPSAITLSAWIKPTAANYGNFIAKGGNSGYRIRMYNDGTIEFLDRGGTNYLFSNATLSLNNWYHIVATGDSSGLKIYINGILDNQNAVAYGGPITSNQLCIGADTVNGEYFSGQIDEVKIFPYALSAAEISVEYNRTAGVALGVGTDPNNPNLQVGTTSALIAWWKMDDPLGASILDSSGNNHYGTLSPGATAPAWVPGKFGKALSFNGASGTVSIMDEPSFDFERTDSFSFSAWVKNNQASSSLQAIFSKYTQSGIAFPGYTLGIAANSRPQLKISGGSMAGAYIVVDGTQTIADGQWHDLAATYDGTSLASGVKMYIDGVGIGTSVITDTLSTYSILNNNLPYIGSENNSYKFNGLIDNLKVFTKVLSAEEVAFEYGKYISNTENAFDYDSGIPSPIAYWKLNEGVGTSAYDELGTYNVGSTNLNPATEWVQGKYLDAVSFDGNNQCFFKLSGSYPHPDTITISMWVKPSSLTSNNYLIGYGNTYMGAYPYYIRNAQGKIEFVWGGTSSPNTDVYMTNNVVLAVGVWSHIVVTNTYGTPSAMKIYVDGQYAPGSWTQGDGTRAKFTSGSAYFTIGSLYNQGGSNYPCYSTAAYAGIMDDVKIFDYALTPNQVTKEFGHGAAVHFGN